MVVYYYPRLTNKFMASFNLVLIFSLLSFIINFVTTEAQFDRSISGPRCEYFNRTTPKSAFEFNLRAVLSDLSSNATANNKPFYNTTVATKNHPESSVYGMFFCWGDVPPQLCSQCVASATKAVFSDPDQVLYCSLTTSAIITYRDCMIRYSNFSFFSTPELNLGFVSCFSVDVSNKTSLMSLYSKTINEVVEKAANSPVGEKKYATKEARIAGFQTLYCEAQCTPDLSPQDCRKCLNVSVAKAQQTCPQDLPMTDVNPSCNMRCDVYPFYRPSTSPPPSELVEVTHSSDTYSQALTELSHNCSSNETMIGSDTTFRSNLKTLFTSLTSKSTANSGFFNNTVDTVSGFFMCFGDLSPTLCELCIQNATQRISAECPSSKEATIWYNHCLLHYSDHPSLPTLDTAPTYRHFNIVNTFKPNQLQSFFTWTLANSLSQVQFDIREEHTTTKNYGIKSGKLNDKQTLYTLAQCRPDLLSEDCNTCLDSIIRKEIPWCCLGSPEGKVLYPSCYIMFGLSPFHSEASLVDARKPVSSSPATENDNGSKTIILIVVPLGVSAILLSFCYYLLRTKTRKTNYNTLLRENFGQQSITLEGLQFDWTTIKAATNNFSRTHKIGKGGFGEVYKGILCDGRQIAVKRLSTKSKQGLVEFKNEVLLIADLQHRNLVSLVGFCLEEEEKILIYEYMSNGSLDYLLFGTQQQKLNWSKRYNIIQGTASGILYLHEYSRCKVIHRDLKPSNVLLDENMNPKISDFGLAKIVEMDQDRGSTHRIAGTYGYISPEYAMFGQFSEKSDIFSFGIIILEIITGKKNVNFYGSHTQGEGIIGYVWKQWKDHEPLCILDSYIKESYSPIEVLKCIHISLLCVQENPKDRPTMKTIISYLNGHSLELPSPQEPTFLFHEHRMDSEKVIQRDFKSNQAAGDLESLSLNEMSMSNFYPR